MTSDQIKYYLISHRTMQRVRCTVKLYYIVHEYRTEILIKLKIKTIILTVMKLMKTAYSFQEITISSMK